MIVDVAGEEFAKIENKIRVVFSVDFEIRKSASGEIERRAKLGHVGEIANRVNYRAEGGPTRALTAQRNGRRDNGAN